MYHYLSLTLDGLQGFLVSILFCFGNNEVRQLLKRTLGKKSDANIYLTEIVPVPRASPWVSFLRNPCKWYPLCVQASSFFLSFSPCMCFYFWPQVFVSSSCDILWLNHHTAQLRLRIHVHPSLSLSLSSSFFLSSSITGVQLSVWLSIQLVIYKLYSFSSHKSIHGASISH